MIRPINVLVVDDSAVVRQAMYEILSAEPDIRVMEGAADPIIAAEFIKAKMPDVIVLDIEMPRMDGLTFLRKIMVQRPIPVVICSSLAPAGSETAFKALEYGAVDVIEKPRLGVKQFLEESRIRICDAVRAAAGAHLKPHGLATVSAQIAKPIALPGRETAMSRTTDLVVAVGASTGGTEALRGFLRSMPADAPGVIIVQHMPENFTSGFAKRLDMLSAMTVKEAEDGDSVIPGRALLAPGNRHMFLRRSGARYHVEVKDGPLINRHRPSVDVLFKSTARYAGRNAVGVLMTGMGSDGAEGLLEMKKAGAATLAQDETTCVVYGMPYEALKLGAVDRVESLVNLPRAVLEEVVKKDKT